jgi:peptidoglycan/LPS O-acetylase OafA/YrhL
MRFIAVLWVVFSHCGYPPLTEGLDESHLLAHGVQGIYGNLFAGVPAVIVFFVISGFCIHYPHRSPGSFSLLPFLVRRYLRIGIPLIAAVLLSRPFHVNLALFQNSILWSLLAELIYYTLYPVLRLLREKFRWQKMIVVSMLTAYAVVLYFPTALDYSPFGPRLAWLVAFPCWLIGCLLAEVNFQKTFSTITRSQVWRWRMGVWFLSSLCSFLRFHSPVGYPWTLNLFAVAVFFWLRVEIAAFRQQQGSAWLEWAGRWSYSVYLLHLIANTAYGRLTLPNLGFNLNWCLKMMFILGVSYLFYLVVEKPGHLIARHLGRWLTLRNSSAVRPRINPA